MDSPPRSPFTVRMEVLMTTYGRHLCSTAAWMVLAATPVTAQPASAPAARELASLMQQQRLETIAARVPETPDTFVAALHMPGQQLILVSGRYAAPALIREKIILGRYRDAYQDLYGASDVASRWVIEDLRADGLRAVPEKGAASDAYTTGGGDLVPLDGDWKRRKLSQDAYMDAFQRADASYATMAAVLVSELKRRSEP
jgi:hypothetical protein